LFVSHTVFVVFIIMFFGKCDNLKCTQLKIIIQTI
jgi:hypothetical protein